MLVVDGQLHDALMRRKEVETKTKNRPQLMDFRDFDACFMCRQEFNFVRAKKHCAHCGYVFCEKCTRNFRDIPDLMHSSARVCGRCAKEIDLAVV